MSTNGLASGFAGIWTALTILAAIASTVFWLVIGWRAMRAHERIAATLEQRLPR